MAAEGSIWDHMYVEAPESVRRGESQLKGGWRRWNGALGGEKKRGFVQVRSVCFSWPRDTMRITLATQDLGYWC